MPRETTSQDKLQRAPWLFQPHTPPYFPHYHRCFGLFLLYENFSFSCYYSKSHDLDPSYWKLPFSWFLVTPPAFPRKKWKQFNYDWNSTINARGRINNSHMEEKKVFASQIWEIWSSRGNWKLSMPFHEKRKTMKWG